MKYSLAAMAAALAFSTSTASALSLTIENQSNWEVHQLYFSPSNQKSWGPDQLEDEVISHGESFKLKKIPQGVYDVKIVDEDGDECTLEDVDFNASEHFELTSKLLLGCQAATEAEDD